MTDPRIINALVFKTAFLLYFYISHILMGEPQSIIMDGICHCTCCANYNVTMATGGCGLNILLKYQAQKLDM